MQKITLDPKKLLGFRLLDGGAPLNGAAIAAKIGDKVGLKDGVKLASD